MQKVRSSTRHRNHAESRSKHSSTCRTRITTTKHPSQTTTPSPSNPPTEIFRVGGPVSPAQPCESPGLVLWYSPWGFAGKSRSVRDYKKKSASIQGLPWIPTRKPNLLHLQLVQQRRAPRIPRHRPQIYMPSSVLRTNLIGCSLWRLTRILDRGPSRDVHSHERGHDARFGQVWKCVDEVEEDAVLVQVTF